SDANTIDYLPYVDPSGCLIRVRAAIYLSLDELWTAPSEHVLIASILDPRFKTFQCAHGEFENAKELLEQLYMTKRTILNPPNDLSIESTNQVALDEEDDNDEFFRQLRTVNRRTSASDELDEVIRY